MATTLARGAWIQTFTDYKSPNTEHPINLHSELGIRTGMRTWLIKPLGCSSVTIHVYAPAWKCVIRCNLVIFSFICNIPCYRHTELEHGQIALKCSFLSFHRLSSSGSFWSFYFFFFFEICSSNFKLLGLGQGSARVVFESFTITGPSSFVQDWLKIMIATAPF